jgi:hypothetical protein
MHIFTSTGHATNVGWTAAQCVVPGADNPFGRIAWAGGLLVLAYGFVCVGGGLIFRKRFERKKLRALFVFNYLLAFCYVWLVSSLFRYLLNCETIKVAGVSLSFLKLDASMACPPSGIRYGLGIPCMVKLQLLCF